MKIIILVTLGSAVAVSTIIGLVIIYGGIFNVATTWEDPSLMRWVLVTTRENSIKKRSASIRAPISSSASQIDEGFRSYREMCAICHTPPGGLDSPIAKGLNPPPADLAESAEHMSASELFWATKNGIRMTGMPGWGVTHKDDELWNIVAFLKELPTINKLKYESMDSRLEKGHSHSSGGDSHESGDSGHASQNESHDDGHSH